VLRFGAARVISPAKGQPLAGLKPASTFVERFADVRGLSKGARIRARAGHLVPAFSVKEIAGNHRHRASHRSLFSVVTCGLYSREAAAGPLLRRAPAINEKNCGPRRVATGVEIAGVPDAGVDRSGSHATGGTRFDNPRPLRAASHVIVSLDDPRRRHRWRA
jgi:hypothetical protein